MKVKPLHDRVIVRRLEETEQRIGGIIVPDTAREKPQKGRIVAVGDGRARKGGGRVPLDVKAGDLVLFGKYSGQEIKVEGDELLIMKEDEVLAVLGASASAVSRGARASKTVKGAKARTSARSGAKLEPKRKAGRKPKQKNRKRR
jgi:chaperonin GroES